MIFTFLALTGALVKNSGGIFTGLPHFPLFRNRALLLNKQDKKQLYLLRSTTILFNEKRIPQTGAIIE
jgi:hypothetical protein